MRYPRTVKGFTGRRPAAGYCNLHRQEMSGRQIHYKGCVDPQKQREYGNDGDCPYLRKIKKHPMWSTLEHNA